MIKNLLPYKHFNCRGFTLFELVVVILLIGIFMIFAIDSLLRLQVEAERVSVQHVVGSLNSAINLEASRLVLDEGVASLKKLENSNPMDYLAEIPFTYLGARSDLGTASLPADSWYFDPNQKILVYKVKNHKNFRSDLSGTPRIRFRVTLVYRNNAINGPATTIQGIHLQSLDNYTWIRNKP
jgi:prepilin-type N-terminal cleavage/methylation domain-containing protein